MLKKRYKIFLFMYRMVESSFRPELGAWHPRVRMPGGAGEEENRGRW